MDALSIHCGYYLRTASYRELDEARQGLTKNAVDELQPRDKQYLCYDTSMPVFGVKAYPSGRKSCVVEYRPRGDGRSVAKTQLVIENIGTMLCEQAQQLARQQLAEVPLGAVSSH